MTDADSLFNPLTIPLIMCESVNMVVLLMLYGTVLLMHSQVNIGCLYIRYRKRSTITVPKWCKTLTDKHTLLFYFENTPKVH